MTAGGPRVGIDYRTALRPKPTGVGRYVRDLVAALAADGSRRYVLLHDRRGAGLPGAPPLPRLATRPAVWRSTAARAVWEELWLPAALVGRGIEVYHSPNALLPFLLPRRIAAVVTIHDLVFRALPETLGAVHLARLRSSAGHALRRADGIIADSQHTARDLGRYYGVPSEAVTVIYPGVDAPFRPMPAEAGRRVARRFGMARPYVLYTGGLGARKNVGTPLDAYMRLRPTLRGDLDLVLVGDTADAGDLLATVRRHGMQSIVHFPGYVPDADLAALYAGATAFVYSSRYEGFGLPVLEAMACGAPVICSDSSSLPEVAGTAGLLVPPRAVEEWARALRAVVESPERQADLRAASLRQAARFSLAAEAAATRDVYAWAYQRSQRRARRIAPAPERRDR